MPFLEVPIYMYFIRLLVAVSLLSVTQIMVRGADAVTSSMGDLFKYRISQMSSYPVSLLYLNQTIQYPNYQEEVFSKNSTVLELLKTKTELVEIRKEYVKAIIGKEVYSIHRVITHDDDMKITLNNRIINNGIKIRSLLYGSRDRTFKNLPLESATLKLDEVGAIDSHLGQLAKPIMPWKVVQDAVLGAAGYSSLDELVERMLSDQSPESIYKFEHDSTVGTISFLPSGLPVEIITLRNNKPILTKTTIEYSVVKMPNGEVIDFPKSVKVLKQIKINGEYKTYMSLIKEIKNVKYLNLEDASEQIAKMDPVSIDAKDIEMWMSN